MSQSVPLRPQWWLWPQVLCLDAPIVTVAWMAALAHGHHLHLQSSFYWGLGLVTWLVYVLDRTADALSGRLATPLSKRHEFCLRHQKTLLFGLAPLAVVIILWLAATQIPAGLAARGMAMCVGGALYLASFSAGRNGKMRTVLFSIAAAVGLGFAIAVNVPFALRLILSIAMLAAVLLAFRSGEKESVRSLVPKEMMASLLITLGCSVGVHFWTPPEHGIFCPEVSMLWGLVALNLVSIHWCEKFKGDHREGNAGQAAGAPPVAQIMLIAGLSICTTITWLAIPNQAVRITALVVVLSALCIGTLHLMVRRLSTELFHTLCDAAMILPLPLLWL